MERRDFLKIIPIAALPSKILADGVREVELPPDGHFVIVIKASSRIDFDALHGILPKGATGWIVAADNPDEDIKFYNLKG